ncbi:protein phosphatase 2C domain-containing protein [uncultured Desulfosarcina sp.]|uniref:PP2C family protein-serine/threonine phosphatase n=1 Tax=uncultured Desulfosarcina sp. TaxID=218289 RepID=UPI0029C98494|nr:protein phosphatase 2C domain-containing protein [uncultured Desulfosarcina sp.]
MIRVQAAGFSDIGKVRKANEDSFILNEPIGLYVVADGMGGHRAGGVASRIAVETIDAYLANPTQEFTDPDGPNVLNGQSAAARHLRESIFLANQKIYKQSLMDTACRGMGTTVSALYLSGNSIITANVGDSPIYLLRNGEIETLYTPHTLLHERKKIPKSMEGRFPSSKLAHILTRAVGIRSDVGMDLVETPCFADDIIVLCSDGLSGKISREEIRDLVYQNDSTSACRKLTDLANQRGGEDNITVIVVRVTSANERPANRLFGRIVGIPAWIVSLFGGKKRS